MYKKGLFLDRDGIINVDYNYVYKIEDFIFCEGIFEFVRYFFDNGYKIFVVTNQSGISRGYYTLEEFEVLTSWMKQEFKKQNIEISGVAFCPHHPDEGCECRKPKPKMIDELAKKHDIDINNSVFIGDKQSDMQAAQNARVKYKILIGESEEKVDNQYNINNLKEALEHAKKIFKY